MTPPVPASAPDTGQIARQLKLFKFLALLLLLVLLVGAGGAWYTLRANQPVQITVDGSPVATARNARVANQLINQAELSKVGPGYSISDIIRLQQVRLDHPQGLAAIDTDDDVQQKLAAALKIHVRAYMIMVDGHPSIALGTQSDANDTIAAVKNHYVDQTNQGELVGDPELISKVTIVRMAVSPTYLRSSPADAAPYFWTPPSPKLYTVKEGDRGMGIAHRNHISYTDLILANPDVNLNRLRVGDQLNVRKMPLLLKVSLQRQITSDEPIVANARAADAGKRRVTSLVTYINGQEVSRSTTSMTTLVKPAVHLDID